MDPETKPVEEQALEALDAALEGKDYPEPAKAEDDVKPDAEPAKADDAPPEPAAKPDKPVEAAKPDEAKSEDSAEKEMADLGIKNERTRERFTALYNENKELRPLKEAMAAAGVTDAAKLPEVFARAKAADEIETAIRSTEASPEQFGMALDYLRLANAAAKGDMKAAEQAYEFMQKELTVWGTLLGKEAAGVDPLAQHQDLAAAVEAGDMSKKYALELAAQRNQARVVESNRQSQTEAERQTQAMEHGRVALNTLGAELAASDPDYAQKVEFLKPTLAIIRQSLPPERWVEATREAYARLPSIPKPAPAPAPKPAPSHVPLRPAGARGSMVAITDDPMEALEQGLAAASGL